MFGIDLQKIAIAEGPKALEALEAMLATEDLDKNGVPDLIQLKADFAKLQEGTLEDEKAVGDIVKLLGLYYLKFVPHKAA